MSEDSPQPIIVTVEDAYLPMIQEVATELQTAGMTVEQVLPTVGIISGSATLEQISRLQTLPGIISVEPDEPMQAI